VLHSQQVLCCVTCMSCADGVQAEQLQSCLESFILQEIPSRPAPCVPAGVLNDMVISCRAVCAVTPQYNRVRARMLTRQRDWLLEQLTHLSFLWMCLGPQGNVWQSCSPQDKTNLKGKGRTLWEQLVTPLTNIPFDTDIARAARVLGRLEYRNDFLNHLGTCHKHFTGGARTLNCWLRRQRGPEPVCEETEGQLTSDVPVTCSADRMSLEARVEDMCNGVSYDIVSFLIPNPQHTVIVVYVYISRISMVRSVGFVLSEISGDN
jgi:hypothetical protein